MRRIGSNGGKFRGSLSYLLGLWSASRLSSPLSGWVAVKRFDHSSDIAVPLSGVVAIAGGLSVLLGYRARLGAWLIVLFLIPVTLMMHKFWTVTGPMMAQIQMILFMKNISMLGGALLISQFGAGPFGLDARRSR